MARQAGSASCNLTINLRRLPTGGIWERMKTRQPFEDQFCGEILELVQRMSARCNYAFEITPQENGWYPPCVYYSFLPGRPCPWILAPSVLDRRERRQAITQFNRSKKDFALRFSIERLLKRSNEFSNPSGNATRRKAVDCSVR
jgi:hypothetical protein